MKRSEKKRVTAYYRVSTDEQDLGLDAQRTAVKKYAKDNGLHIVDEFEDNGISGTAGVDKRPGLYSAIHVAKKHRRPILVAKRDRVGRDTMLMGWIELELRKRGSKIITATGDNGVTPHDELMRAILDAFSQFERDMISMRTKAALLEKMKRGERVGGIKTFGYELDDDGNQRPCETEQKLIKLMRQWHKKGLSYRRIGERLAKWGMFSRSGTNFHPQTIKTIIERENKIRS